ncbi:kinase-like domain-containing protein [Irpex lacteus]|nr:kinase-like domain-containing protein [Irpex lacteus]
MIDNWHHSASPYTFGFGPSSSSYSSSSSTRSSHLSILTTPSSTLSRTSTSSETADHPPSSPTTSSGSKTDAFFASPFSTTAPLPPEPFSAPVASTSKSSFASDADATPRMENTPAPTTKKSLNDSFFSPSWQTSPLPPLHQEKTRALQSAPATTSAMRVPLSRVFPSRVRYTSVDELPSREGSPQGYNSSVLSTSPRLDLAVGNSAISGLTARAELLHLLVRIKRITTITGEHLHVHIPTSLEAAHANAHHRGSSKLPTPVEVHEQIVPVACVDIWAFSSVWLARDETGRVSKLEVSRKNSLKRQKSKGGSLRRSGTGAGSLQRRNKRASESSDDAGEERQQTLDGIVPKIRVTVEEGSDGRLRSTVKVRGSSVGRGEERSVGRLVALKMTDKSLCDKDDRTRVSFVREVEVLKHIAHPSIVAYIHAFSTPYHHVLVLEHVAGGELFDLVSSQETHARLHEPLLRRIFGELCRAVAWMHAVGLVHRDLKLENILLTRDAFDDSSSPAPLIKISDFGLSRFIDPSAPSSPLAVAQNPTPLLNSSLDVRTTVAKQTLGRAESSSMLFRTRGMVKGQETQGPRRDERAERRSLLMRIANGQYSWPNLPDTTSSRIGDSELKGTDLARSEGVRRVVGRLLVRDPRKRAKLAQLWEDEWMNGEGAPSAPVLPEYPGSAAQVIADASKSPVEARRCDEFDDLEEYEEDGDGEDGVLVDEHNIAGSVACQELMPP